MSSKKSSIFMLFGIIIGLCFGFVFKNYKALELVKRCSHRPNNEIDPLELINLSPDDSVANSQNNLLFVGVMTAKDFLDDRAKAVYDTWGKEVPGRLAFFSSDGSVSDKLPVVGLKDVDDRYPPQKKSFRMLYYMYEHYIDRFEWFARADDDVYINTRKLEKFLRSIDSTKPQFIGQAGRGNSEEFGLLSLEFDENFCMGGPGVIMSRETLRRVAPHIPVCLKNLYSTHEDVEVGRCVQKFAGIPCTWNYEMQLILHHNSSGVNAFTGNLKSKEIHNAITLHPIKHTPLMYRLHSYMQGLRAQELRQATLSLHRDIAMMKSLLLAKSTSNEGHLYGNSIESELPVRFDIDEINIFPSNEPTDPKYLGDHDILGTKPHLNKAKVGSRDDLQVWNFIAHSLYSAENTNPKKKVDSAMRGALNDIVVEVMDYINNFSRQRGRVIEFRELLYGYSRTNAVYGHDLILDLLLIYKKYRGKKMTVPVRRHLYLQRAFTDCFVREMYNDSISDALSQSMDDALDKPTNLTSLWSSKVRKMWDSSVERISDTLALPINSNATVSTRRKHLPSKHAIATPSTIVFVLSLAGRYQTFLRFLENYGQTCLKHPELRTELLIVIFRERNVDLLPYFIEIEKFQQKYPSAALNHLTLNGNFSRGVALNTATNSSFIKSNDIIFFIDVDITFTRTSIERIRLNTILHRQVYMPIVFSQYQRHNTIDTAFDATSETDLNDELGYFRQFGYGICAIYKADILHPMVNGFNTDIAGWGLEDVKFLEQLIQLNLNASQMLKMAMPNTAAQAVQNEKPLTTSTVTATPPSPSPPPTVSPIALAVFRAPDPSLVHVYHDIQCDKNLSESQYFMCLGTKASTLGSYKYIESLFMKNRKFSDSITSDNNNDKNKIS